MNDCSHKMSISIAMKVQVSPGTTACVILHIYRGTILTRFLLLTLLETSICYDGSLRRDTALLVTGLTQNNCRPSLSVCTLRCSSERSYRKCPRKRRCDHVLSYGAMRKQESIHQYFLTEGHREKKLGECNEHDRWVWKRMKQLNEENLTLLNRCQPPPFYLGVSSKFECSAMEPSNERIEHVLDGAVMPRVLTG